MKRFLLCFGAHQAVCHPLFTYGSTTSSLILRRSPPRCCLVLYVLSLDLLMRNSLTMSTIAAMTRLVLVGIVPLVTSGNAIQQNALRGGGEEMKVGAP